MEDSEIRRAISAPGRYFLAVISGIEGTDARPRVRLIADPVSQLTVTSASTMILSGISAAKDSLVYDLNPATQQ
jgi:hypothetical protein